jgi:hypothetical protein
MMAAMTSESPGKEDAGKRSKAIPGHTARKSFNRELQCVI